MGPEWLVLIVAVVVVALVVMSGRRSPTGRGESTVGHYDPNAIGGYVLDPATQTYRYQLPNVAQTGRQMAPGEGPPHRRRRRRRRPTDPRG